ncbi:MAG: 4-phosphopantetheinyl transferase family protein [Gemmatimonadetes bacterium]|nr:4-phosphopantetheinyl transferase family protein [Gemmatimonadota bacterium]
MTPPPRGTAQASAVGNDVVDLLDPSTSGKHVDGRFLDRVLAPAERADLARSDDPAVTLWAFWAAKEAAYKSVSKLLGTPPVFAHASFVATWTEARPERWVGRVAYEELHVSVVATRSRGAVHAVALWGAEPASVLVGVEPLEEPREAWRDLLARLLPRLSAREADAVHSFPSAAVRIRARATLAPALAAEEAGVELVCDPGVTGRRPPRAVLAGKPAAADVSLSHHGSWIAWAVLPQNPLGR